MRRLFNVNNNVLHIIFNTKSFKIFILNEKMEGATSKIDRLKNGWVRKTLKRQAKKTTTPVETQMEIQNWSASILTPENGFKLLFTPKARESSYKKNSYEMEEIDNENPIDTITSSELQKEIELYFQYAYQAGFYPSDFELYEQPDKRIALIDFDKFGTISKTNKTVEFPYRGKLPLNTTPIEALYSENLSQHIQKIMTGSGKKRTQTRKRKTRKY